MMLSLDVALFPDHSAGSPRRDEWLKEHAWKLPGPIYDGLLQISITVAKPTT